VTDRRRIALEKNDQRADIDEAMGEGGGDEDEEDESEDEDTHTHTTYSIPYIYTFLCVSHTNTLEVLHLIPCPNLPTINLVDTRSLLIRSC
jgi:hypothetical protein